MKTVNKILSLILSVVMLMSVCVFNVAAEETASITLTDIDRSTVEGKSVERLVSMGIINGYPDGTYRPNNVITRAEFSVVMVKFLGMQDQINPEALTNFEDLDLDENYAWARPYVSMAVARGIINGFEDGTFRAADPVTYEQAVKMIVCALGYGERAKMPTITGDWSSGYIAQAMKLGVTKNTSIANKSKNTTRGVVAILTNNALDAEESDLYNENGDKLIEGDEALSDLGYEEIKGIVTGTYITELTDQDSSVPKNHIMIDDELYEIGFSTSPYEFLGCGVEAVVYEDRNTDYPVIKSLKIDRRTEVTTVDAKDLGAYNKPAGIIEYYDGRWKEQSIKAEPVIILNEKLYDKKYDFTKLSQDLKTGYVDFIDNTGDGVADVVRINSYDVHVVYSKSSSSQKITFMYEDKDSAFTFPKESTSILFSLTRNGKEIQFKDIAKWDVLNIKASDENADGPRLYEVVVTRRNVSGTVTESDVSNNSVYINDEEYFVAKSYRDLVSKGHEDAVELEVGEPAQVYLDEFDNIVAVAKASNTNSSEKYAYLWRVRQNDEASEYDLEFWLYDTNGKQLKIGAAPKIEIDGTKKKAEDDDILDRLRDAAIQANGAYPMAENYGYHQPILYQTNSDGLVSVIHTVLTEENENISMVMKESESYVEYGYRTYKSTGKSFTDFKVSSSTKIIFVPDNRGETEDYLTLSYSKAFSNAREYHVEAFGVTSSKTASLVLLYHENDTRLYTSATPWMIVASKSSTKDGTIVKGYKSGTSYSLSSVTVSEDNAPDNVSGIGKGDIIRYIVDGKGQMIDCQIWYDASDPVQLNKASSSHKALYDDGDPNTDGINRILEVHSTDTKPRDNYPTATFRLQFGTVTDIFLKTEGVESVDEESITVSPVIREDKMEFDFFEKQDAKNDSTISKSISSSLKVFSYDSRTGDITTEADLAEILPYSEYGEDATRVIAYTAGGTLRMIYIIQE